MTDTEHVLDEVIALLRDLDPRAATIVSGDKLGAVLDSLDLVEFQMRAETRFPGVDLDVTDKWGLDTKVESVVADVVKALEATP